MKDMYGRTIDYVRVSLTELCNLRCRYCMPEEGIKKKCHSDMMTEEELISFLEVGAKFGIKKVRLTGGEPLVKKNIIDICEKASKIQGIKELCITTNGLLLEDMALDLKKSGVSRINISLDTLKPEKFFYITRKNALDKVLKGIERSLELGFSKIKINTVLMGGFNDDEISDIGNLTLKYPVEVRFIELMPMGIKEGMENISYIPSDYVLEKLSGLKKIEDGKGVARLYKLENSLGEIGLISPISNHFCGECNRIRLTADGFVKPCLHSSLELSIRGKSRSEIEEIFINSLKVKPKEHKELSESNPSEANRFMYSIGG